MKALKSNAIGRCAKPSQMRRLVARVLVAAGVMALATQTQAINVSLTAGDAFGTSSFNSAGNWSNLAAPSAGNNYFISTTLRTPTSGAHAFAGDSLQIDAGGSLGFKTPGVITVNDLRMNGGLINQSSVGGLEIATLAGNLQLVANSSINSAVAGRTMVVNSTITGGSNLSIQGLGVTQLSGTNTYTGGTTLSGGILSISSAANLGAPLGAALVDFTGNATLNVTNSFTTTKEFTSIGAARSITLDIDSGDVLTANGNIRAFSGAGTVTKSGLGTLIIGANNTQLDTDITLTGGTLDVRNAGGIGNSAAGDFVLASAGTTTRLTFNANTTVTGSFQTQGSGVALVVDRVAAGAGTTTSMTNLILNGADTLNVSAGANVTSGTAGLTFSGTTTLNGNAIINVTDPGAANILLTLAGVTGTNRNLTIGGNGNTTINGNITTGSGTLVKNGDGLLILNGANTFTGNVAVQDGILNIRNSAALGAAAKTVTVAGGGNTPALELQNNINVTVGTLQTSGSGVGGNGVLRNISGNNTITATSNIFLIGGNGSSEWQSDAGLLTVNGNISDKAGVGNSRTLTLDGVSDGLITGSMSNGDELMSLAKKGIGTWTLTGNSSYTGNTTINGGTLLVNNTTGSGTGSGNVIINSGGTFGGNGSITGGITLNSGGILSPGSSIESLVSGSNIWNGGSSYEFEFSTDGSGVAGIGYDLLAINGTLNLSGASNANPINIDLITMLDATTPGVLASWNPFASTTWLGFVTTTGGVISFSQDKFVFDTSGFQSPLHGNFSVVESQGRLDLLYIAIPEPATMSLLALGGLAMLRRRRVMR